MEHTSKPNRSSLCYFLLVGDQNDIVRFLGLCCVASEEFGRKSQTFTAIYTGKIQSRKLTFISLPASETGVIAASALESVFSGLLGVHGVVLVSSAG